MIANDREMDETVFAALCACLGVAAGTDAANRLIHKAYIEPENAPQPPRERDVIYYWIERDTATDDDFQAMAAGCGWGSELVNTEICSYLAYRLVVVCYGPHSEEYAHRIRALIFLDGVRKPRGILRAAGIYPIPRPAQPEIIREPIGSLWRKRADLVISLRVRDSLVAEQGAVGTVPEIRLRR